MRWCTAMKVLMLEGGYQRKGRRLPTGGVLQRMSAAQLWVHAKAGAEHATLVKRHVQAEQSLLLHVSSHR